MNTTTKRQAKQSNSDILAAETNWIEHSVRPDNGKAGYVQSAASAQWHGPLARKLLDSPDYSATPSPYSVWELTGDYYDWQTDCALPVAILRANQSTLECALRYMGENKVLVWNKYVPEKENV